jgi:hypothetical protein
MAEALRQRGAKDPGASLSAEAGIAVLKIAFERWVNGSDELDLPTLIRALFDDLKDVTAGR